MIRILTALCVGLIIGLSISAYASRNASGTYTLPTGNPVVSGTVISSSWANTTLSDIRTEMTDSLSRSGKGGMLAPVLCVAGTSAAPAFSFTTDPTSGLYRAGAGDLRMAVAGADKEKWTSTGVTITGTETVSGALTVQSGGLTETGTLNVIGDMAVSATSTFSGAVVLPVSAEPPVIKSGQVWVSNGSPAVLGFFAGGIPFRIYGGKLQTNGGTGVGTATVLSTHNCVCSSENASFGVACVVGGTTLTATLTGVAAVNVNYICF